MVRKAVAHKSRKPAHRRMGTLAKVGAFLAAPFPDAELAVAALANPNSGIKFVLGIKKKAGKRISETQSVIFDKLKWTADTAKQWLHEHGFTGTGKDEGATFWRFRQQSPGKYKEFRTVVPGARRNPYPEELGGITRFSPGEAGGRLLRFIVTVDDKVVFQSNDHHEAQLKQDMRRMNGEDAVLWHRGKSGPSYLKSFEYRAENPDVADAISSYDEHLGMTTRPEFQEATPDEQAAAMTAMDLCENPGWTWAYQYADTSKTEAAAREELDGLKLQDGYLAGRIYLRDGVWHVQALFQDEGEQANLPDGVRRVQVPPSLWSQLEDGVVRGREGNPYDEEGHYYLTPERMAESERGFGEQFFTAGRGFGTTIQSARSRVKKWSKEVASGDTTHAKDLTYYVNAIAHYEKLKKEGHKPGPGGKRNPESSAASLYESFHGKPPGEVKEIITDREEHEWLTQLGTLRQIKVYTVTNRDATLDFTGEDAPDFASNEEGTQLFIEGGDQALPLGKLGMGGDKWQKESILIGQVYEATYETEKSFDDFKRTLYFHQFADPKEPEGKDGERPTLVYDRVNKLLSLVGGTYKIAAPGVLG